MKYVILSSNLVSGAPGHFLPFHETLFKGFTAKGLDVTYLGGREKSDAKTWYRPVLSPGLNKPIPWIPYGSFSKKIRQVTKDYHFTLIVFEGNLAVTFLVAQYLMRHKKGIAIVNQFRGDKLSKNLRGGIKGFLHKILYRALIGVTGHRLVLSSDNPNLQKILEQKLNYPIAKFHMFSPLCRADSETRLGNKVLILVRGSEATELVLQALLSRNRHTNYVVHGISKQKLTGDEYSHGIEMLRTKLNPTEYRESYLEFNSTIIMYSPKDFAYVSSGRIYDALCMGVPVYAPRDTSMATEIENEFIFNFDSEAELVSVMNKPANITVLNRNREKFTVDCSVSELVKTSDLAFSKISFGRESKTQLIQELTMRFGWVAYGLFSFILLRGFLKPEIFFDSLKMRLKRLFLSKR